MALATQLDIPLEGAEAHDALHYWADSLAESRGEVFTKTEVVEFILDLVGWRVGSGLLTQRLLEPSCGSGDFVVPAVLRLLADALREMIAESFHLDAYIDFTGIDAFHGQVTAYPSVTIIRNGSGERTQVVDKEDVDCATLPELSTCLLDQANDPRIKYLSNFKEKRALLAPLQRRPTPHRQSTGKPPADPRRSRVQGKHRHRH